MIGAASAAARIQIGAELGWADTFVAGGWTPLRLMLENFPDPQAPVDDSRDFNGQVRLTVRDRDGAGVVYTRPIELPRHGRKGLEFTIALPDVSNLPVLIELVDRQGGIVARSELQRPMSGYATPNLRQEARVIPTVLLAADPNETVTYPTWVASALNIKPVRLEALPSDYRGYDGVRLLVARHRLSVRLSEDQLRALETWVELGGRLLMITPRALAELKLDPWLAPRWPAPPQDVAEIRLSELGREGGQEVTLVTVWGPPAPESRILWASRAGPLALERSVGAGQVIALGIDPSTLSSVALQSEVAHQLRGLLEAVALGPDREDLRARHYWSTADIEPPFTNVLLLPNIWVVTGLLILFVLFVGPVNFYLLRRRRRLELAWVSIPALSIFFFIAVYAYGLVAKGGQQHYASAEIVHVSPGGSRGLVLWNSIQFSPRRRLYRFTPPEGGLMLPFMAYYDNPTDQRLLMTLRNLRLAPGQTGVAGESSAIVLGTEADRYDLLPTVEQWKIAFYQGERPLTLEGSIHGRVVLRAGGTIDVQIDNQSPARLFQTTLCLGERRYSLPDVEPGQRLRVADLRQWSRAWARTSPVIGEDPFPDDASRKIHEGAYVVYPLMPGPHPQRRSRLIARQEQWTSDVRIEPAPQVSKRIALVELELPVQIEGRVDFVSASRDVGQEFTLLRRQIYDYHPTGVTFPAGEFCSLIDGWAETLFAPPDLPATASLLGGVLRVVFTPQLDRFGMSVFSYATGRWEAAMEGVDSGPGQALQQHTREIPIRPEWVNPFRPLIRVRLASSRANAPAPPGAPAPQAPAAWSRFTGVTVHALEATLAYQGPVGPASAERSEASEAASSASRRAARVEPPAPREEARP